MKKLLSFVLLAGLVATLYAPATMHACSCVAREYSSQEKMDASTAVFLGTVTSVTQTELNNTATFDVSAYWKGSIMKTETVTTARDSAACGYNFTVGTKYLVYANASEGKYTTGLCGFTNVSTDAAIAAMGPALIPTTLPGGPVVTPVKFAYDLSYGMRSEDVKMLQQYLNANGFPVAITGAGSAGYETTYYGPATQKAVYAFQESHKAELGIAKGTGYFGPITRAFVNK